MKTVTDQIEIATQGNTDIIDITEKVVLCLKKQGLRDGIVVASIAGSTASVTTCEYEPGLVADLKEAFGRLIPSGGPYAHDAAWGDGNGSAHLRASLLGPSLTVPFCAGALALGTWQQIIVIDFDNRPRKRKVILQFMGE